jgi:hypothetical protein
MNPFDLFKKYAFTKGAQGVRIIVSVGTKSSWHAYITCMGWAGNSRMFETGETDDAISALAELESKVAAEMKRLGLVV